MKSLPALRSLLAVSFATVVCLLGQAAAQTVTPPNVPGMTVPFPYLYLNSPGHWGYMSPQNANPTQSGFLQSVPVTRIVGGQGVHWGDIMTAPPVAGDGNAHYDAGLKGLGMNYDTSISGDSDCANITNQYWWPMATCFSQNGHYSANPTTSLHLLHGAYLGLRHQRNPRQPTERLDRRQQLCQLCCKQHMQCHLKHNGLSRHLCWNRPCLLCSGNHV